MKSKLFKTLTMAGICLMATTSLSLANSFVSGQVNNRLQDGQYMTNNVGGNFNKASIASIDLKNSRVDGGKIVWNRINRLRGTSNYIRGTHNKAAIAAINMENTTLRGWGGGVHNVVTDGVYNAHNTIYGHHNTAGIASVDLKNAYVRGTITNTARLIGNSSNHIRGNFNKAMLGSVSAKNSGVYGRVINHTERMLNARNIVAGGTGNTVEMASVVLE